MRLKKIFYITLITNLFLIWGCKETDNTAPTVDETDQISIIEVTGNTITFSWDEASDNASKQSSLQYRIYASETPIPDEAAISETGNPITAWYTDIGRVVADYTIEGSMYFNLLVKDEKDNTSAYRGTGFIETTYTETGDQIMILDSGGMDNFLIGLDLGASNREVYYIFTNAAETGGSIRPIISEPTLSAEGISASARGVSSGMDSIRTVPAGNTSSRPAALRDRPGMPENEVLIKHSSRAARAVMAPSGDEANVSTLDFKIDSATDIVGATCRGVVEANGIILNIWVADDCWAAGGSTNFLVTQTMVDAMANEFLLTGTDNDIYEWVSGIFGEEWGEHDYSNLIGDNDEITILLFDIDGDGADASNPELPYTGNSYTAGYFWSKDNQLATSNSASNERIMFYMDGPVFACPDNSGPWSVTDYYPRDQISTLAHEFQHMIGYYQKNIIYDADPETWLNEMCSMVAEDLVADKIGIAGPRGVDSSDPTAGAEGNTEGRLPRFNYYNDGSLSTWYSGDMVLASYSISYAFGAYLARNYGGAGLFRDIVRNSYTDEQALINALAENGYSLTMEELMTGWGASVLLSDSTTVDPGFRYNSTSTFESSSDGHSYSLGAINLYNYQLIDDDHTQTGPWLYKNGSTNINLFPEHEPRSNIYYIDGGGAPLTGQLYRGIEVSSGVKVTIVIKA